MKLFKHLIIIVGLLLTLVLPFYCKGQVTISLSDSITMPAKLIDTIHVIMEMCDTTDYGGILPDGTFGHYDKRTFWEYGYLVLTSNLYYLYDDKKTRISKRYYVLNFNKL